MSPRLPNPAFVNRNDGSANSWRDWSAPPRNGYAVSNLCLAILIAALWLATRPYSGVVHDARFYTVQALSALLPGRFTDDLYFRYGSQDQFTFFTLVYKPAMAAFGIGKAAILLTIFGQALWVAGLVYLAQAIFGNARSTLVAVAMAVALPGGVVLAYGEPFLTPRLFAEAITLGALGSMLRGRSLLALFLLGLSMTIHPIMTLPGFVVWYLREAIRRPALWVVGASMIVVAIVLALLDVRPFARLLATFDPEWFAVVRIRDFICLITEWSFLQWAQTTGLFVLAGLGLTIAMPRERRFFILVLIAALGGLVVTLIGGDFLHNVLIVDIQQYRATWLLAVVSNLFVGMLLLRTWNSPTSTFTRASILISVIILAMARLVSTAYYVSIPILAIAGFASIWEQKWRRPIPAALSKCGFAFLGMACALTVIGLLALLLALESQKSVFLNITFGLGLTSAAVVIVSVFATSNPGVQNGVARRLIACSLGLTIIAALTWDHRSPWTKFIETADAAPEALSSLLSTEKQIYWDGDVRVPWFVLKRPSYFSCPQGSGALFFRGTAIAYQHRYDVLSPLRTLDFGQETTCPPARLSESAPFDRETLTSICRKETDLGAIVLTRPVASLPEQIWISPVAFDASTQIGGMTHWVLTNRFYIYTCAMFR